MPARTSRLLIAEPPLIVLPTLAVHVGLNEAIFLQQLHYWLQQSGKERDGRLWVYNTYDDWQAQLPFWSARTIRRVVGDLEDRGIILSTSDYNQTRIDKTKWYTISYEDLDRLLETADHVANVAARTGQDEHMDVANLNTPIPETTQRQPQRDRSKGTEPRRMISQQDRAVIESFVEDYAREFRDRAPKTSSVTRAVNLYAISGLDLDRFLDVLQEARTTTQRVSGNIVTFTDDGSGRKSKMGYWFSVVEDLLNQVA